VCVLRKLSSSWCEYEDFEDFEYIIGYENEVEAAFMIVIMSTVQMQNISEPEPESSSEEEPCVSACSDSEDDGGPGPHAEPERPNNKGYLKCEMCDHWLPWLWDKKLSLCAKCSKNKAIRDFPRECA